MFDFSKIEIKLIPNNEAKQFMQKYHYTKSCPKSTYALGFYYNNQLCTMIVYGQPSNFNLVKGGVIMETAKPFLKWVGGPGYNIKRIKAVRGLILQEKTPNFLKELLISNKSW